jgi:hypothetical protein
VVVSVWWCVLWWLPGGCGACVLVR